MPRSNSVGQVGRYEFLLLVVLIAAAGQELYLLQGRFGQGISEFVVDYLPVFLGLAWLNCVDARFKDIGWSSWYSYPYELVVLGVCVLANHFRSLDFPQWLALIAVLQIPIAILRSKPSPVGPLSDSTAQESKEGAKHSELIGPVGRFVFLLRVTLVAACWAAIFQLGQRADSRLALQELGAIAILFAIIWFFDVEGRLMDAGVSRSYSFYYGVIVALVSIFPFVLKMLTIPQTLILFVLVQTPTVLLKSKPDDAMVLAWEACHEETLRNRRLRRVQRARRAPYAQRIFFGISVLLMVVLWSFLDTWSATSNFAIESLPLDFASFFLCFVWAVLVGMRLGEAGLSRWHKDTFLFVMAACLLPFAYKVVDFHQMLGLFVLLQIPLFFARSKPMAAESLPELTRHEVSIEEGMEGVPADEGPGSPAQERRTPRAKVKGPAGFLRGLLVLAFLWLVMIHLGEVFAQGVGVWIARLGYAFLGFLWFGLAGLRFRDAGLFEVGLYPFSIAVSTASLLPLMLGFTNGYQSLAIFVLIQIPTVFLRSKPQPADPAQGGTAQQEGEECLRDPLGGILVRRTDDVPLTQTRRRSTPLASRGFGGGKRVPKWRK